MQQLPINTSEDFLAETEKMDLSELKDKQFAVAVNTGDRNAGKFLTSTIHGPYSFAEMCQEVGSMYQEHQHHAKVIVLNKDPKTKVKVLDENTVDYIECHYIDIITDAMLDGVFEEESGQYTCRANIIEHTGDEA